MSSLNLNPTVEDNEILVHVPRFFSYSTQISNCCIDEHDEHSQFSLCQCAQGDVCCFILFFVFARLTKETVIAMQKLVKKEGESAKLSVRNVRRDILDAAKKISSTDDRKRLEKQVRSVQDDQLNT